jgi:hypothetical protein
MFKRRWLYSLFFVLALPLVQGRADDPGAKVWNVLMIGNSYTYFNNLPRIFEELGRSDEPSRRVHCEMVTEGGATLQRHWEGPAARKAIARGGWDYVVIQEQSTLGVTSILNGQPRISDPTKYFASARRFDEPIRKAGARTVIFAFWARENVPAEDHNTLTFYHFKLGNDLGALVAPVGLAWQSVRKGDPKAVLYRDDHSHPGPVGSYLAACVLYATCFGKSPAHPPQRVTGTVLDVDGKPAQKQEGTLVELTGQAAQELRDAADQAIVTGREFIRTLDSHKPKPLEAPRLEHGRRPTVRDLEGEWTGHSNVYPSGGQPGVMTLRLTQKAGSWQADAKINFGGKAPDIVPNITNFQITDDGISFEDANKAPNGGGTAKYRAAFTGDALRGIAEITRNEASLHVVGSWELTKKK